MDQRKAPLFEKLCQLAASNRSSFHVPGHKFGQDLAQDERHWFQQVMSIDYTEIPGLDDLHQPQGVIQEAQELAASCFKAAKTFFLVNGSTVGNLALILSVCERNDMIIVQRNVHKSIIHGLMLAGAQAVFLPPSWDEASGLASGVKIEDVETALQEYPQAKAVLLTNPDYYGRGIDLRTIAERVHLYNKPLLVDEAHGAHYGFHPMLPESALSRGADGVVQSTHKMLTALTMGAMLHIQGDLLREDVIRQRLAILQSSSPSYPIMASLDISRRLVATEGEQRLSAGLEAVNQFKQSLQQLPYFSLAACPSSEHETQDPFKVAIKDNTGTLTGYQLQSSLEGCGCIVEMADPVYTLLSFSLSSKKKDSQMLFEAFCQISKQFGLEKKELQGRIANINKLPQFTLKASPVLFELPYLTSDRTEEKKRVRLEEAAHTRSAEMVIPYPPGIPLLYPGEIIAPEMIEYLKQLSSLGATFQGVNDVHLKTIQTYK
jgi:arginine decarboxylase